MSLLIGNPTANLGITLQTGSALDGVVLSPGQSISGKVQSVNSDGTVTLSLAGKTVEAVTEVPLAGGQEINLEVVGSIDGRLYLKLSGEPATASLVEPGQLMNQLTTPRLSNSSVNQTSLVATLLENQLPVTDKNLAALSRVVSALISLGESQGAAAVETGTASNPVRPEPTPDLKLAGFILAAGLKDQPEVWPVLKDYFQQPANLGASLEKLVQGLSTLIPEETAPSPGGASVTPTTAAAVSDTDVPIPANASGSTGRLAAAGTESSPAAGGTVGPGQTSGGLIEKESSVVITSGFSTPEKTFLTAPILLAEPGADKTKATVGQAAASQDKSVLPETLSQDSIQAQVQTPAADRVAIRSVQPVPGEGQEQPAPNTILTNAGLVTAEETSLTQPAGVNYPTGAEVNTVAPTDADTSMGTVKYTAPAELELYGRLLTDLLGASGQASSPAGKVLTQMSALIGLLNQEGQPLDTEEIKSHLREWLSIQKSLAQLLNLVKTEIGKEEVAKALLHNKLVELGEAVNSSLQEVVGQQVINTVDKSRPTTPDYYYFSWPLQYQNQESQAELRVYRQKPRNQPIDINDLYLVFCLQTPNLGTNRFDIHLRQKRMEFRVMVEKDGAVEMVQEAWPELAGRLEELGFQADLIECRSGTPEQLRPQPEARASLDSLRRIDVLV